MSKRGQSHPLADASCPASLGVVCAQAAEGLPQFDAHQRRLHRVLAWGFHVLHDARGHVHAVPQAKHDLAHGLWVLRLEWVRQQPVADVLQRLNVPVAGEVVSARHGLVEVDVVVEEAQEAVAQVDDAQEDLRGQDSQG